MRECVCPVGIHQRSCAPGPHYGCLVSDHGSFCVAPRVAITRATKDSPRPPATPAAATKCQFCTPEQPSTTCRLQCEQARTTILHLLKHLPTDPTDPSAKGDGRKTPFKSSQRQQLAAACVRYIINELRAAAAQLPQGGPAASASPGEQVSASLLQELEAAAKQQPLPEHCISREDLQLLQRMYDAYRHAVQPEDCKYCSADDLEHTCQLKNHPLPANFAAAAKWMAMVLQQPFHLFMEEYAGSGLVAILAEERGRVAITSDWLKPADMQVDYSEAGQMWLLNLLKRMAVAAGMLVAIHAGIECDAHSIANRKQGPAREKQREQALEAARPVLKSAQLWPPSFSVENPAGSASLWRDPDLKRACPCTTKYCLCMQGGAVYKPSIAGSSHPKLQQLLSPLLLECNDQHRCQLFLSGKGHTWWDRIRGYLREVYPTRLALVLAAAHITEQERILSLLRTVSDMKAPAFASLWERLAP